jgi:phospho-N-acetylmuramoyl-pentapeptide-transferase
MFYWLSGLRSVIFEFNIFKYITFRAAMAAVTTFVLCLILGPLFIKYSKERAIRERAKRDDCPALDKFQNAKEGVPTMGGVFIIGSIVLSVLLWADLSNQYIILTLLTCLFFAILGGVDDYVKLKQKGKHRGVRARTKFLWEILWGCGIGAYLYWTPGISTQIDVPFLKTLVVDLGLLYVPFVALVIVGATNAVNLTDGMDGLAIGCVMIVSATLSVLCYVSGHLKFSEYLLIPYLPGTGELTIFCFAILGASLGFLWFNCHPASVFMGDVGSLALGGTLGAIVIFIKKELLLVILGGVFVIEALSVILQVASYKTRRKRIFKMSPFHHHLQLSGWPESKITIRFWILGIILALLTLTTLKIR